MSTTASTGDAKPQDPSYNSVKQGAKDSYGSGTNGLEKDMRGVTIGPNPFIPPDTPTTTLTHSSPSSGQPRSSDLPLSKDVSDPAVHRSAVQTYGSEPRANQVQPLQPVAVDVGSSSISSYVPPTPIHLTIHSDPADEARQQQADKEAAKRAAAIVYLQSVHPALPPTSTAPPAHPHTHSEGAAASLNGQWKPLDLSQSSTPLASSSSSSSSYAAPSASYVSTSGSSLERPVIIAPLPSPPPVHGDQVYASESSVEQCPPMAGRVAKTGPHDQQSYSSSAQVAPTGDEKVAGAAAASLAASSHVGKASETTTRSSGVQPVTVLETSREEDSLPRGSVYPAAAPVSAQRVGSFQPMTVLRPSGDSTTVQDSASSTRASNASVVATAVPATSASTTETTGTASRAQYGTTEVIDGESSGPSIVMVGDAGAVRGSGREVLAVAATPSTTAPVQPQVFSASRGAAIVLMSSGSELPSAAAPVPLAAHSSLLSSPVKVELEPALPAHSSIVLTETVGVHPSVAENVQGVHQVDYTTVAGAGGAEHTSVHQHAVKLGQGIVDANADASA